MQYFCGLTSFQTKQPFDSSLFVDIRKRMGAAKFDAFNDVIIRRIESLKPKRKQINSSVSKKQDATTKDKQVPEKAASEQPTAEVVLSATTK